MSHRVPSVPARAGDPLREPYAGASTSHDAFAPPGPRVGRGSFLQLVAAGVGGLLVHPQAALAAGPRPRAGTSTYQVGVGNSSDPYAATQRAVTASGGWPPVSLAGQTVVIKPNLVTPKPSTSGATTDPQVVRAIVDLALAAGAATVLIVEGGIGQKAPPYATCGYSFFTSYDPQGRVQLIDLATEPLVAVPIRNGLAYRTLLVPGIVRDPNVVFISAAKMKCHVNAGATLSMKNLFGLASPAAYWSKGQILLRYDLHARSVDESIVDLNQVRPVDFAVVDGVWAMEGNGPLTGTPIQTNLVVAGGNAVAVDRICLQAMSLSPAAVPHLTYATFMGMGPADTSPIQVLGDSFTPTPFIPAQTPPVVWYPSASPAVLSLGAGQPTTLTYANPAACQTRVEIITDNDRATGVTVVRTLHDWAARPAGSEQLQWDGRDDNGAIVPMGLYQTRVLARYASTTQIGHTVGWVGVGP